MEYTLVTGACGGLGRAFAEILASRGEPLYLTGRSEERLGALASALRARYPTLCVRYHPCDLSESEQRTAFFAHLAEEGVSLCRLVYVAGVDTQMAFEKFTEPMLLLQARVNFEGAVSFVRGFLSFCPQGRVGEILTVGSMSASTPMPYFALYSASKKALEQFSAGLREELKSRAKVTCVLPGGMPTRDDIRENIKTHGFFGKLSAMSPHSVALRSLRAVQKNRRRVIIGGWNKLLYYTEKAVPMSVKMRIICKIWGKTEKNFYAIEE